MKEYYKNNILLKIWLFVFIELLIILDQVTKLIMKVYLLNFSSIPIIDPILYFTYVENRGAAFGIFENKILLLILLTSILIIIMIVLIVTNKSYNKFYLISLSLLISGGLGNLIDRIFRGYVIDFINIKIMNFAVFNFADIYVLIGAILFIIYIYRYNKYEFI